jgi:phosphodiesterase/alkaline phosphatase D-like protein
VSGAGKAGTAQHARIPSLLAALALGAAALAVAAPSASAAYLHSGTPTEAFGVDGTSGSEVARGGGGLAVDPARHRLYYLQRAEDNIYAFDVSTPGAHTPVSGFPQAAAEGSLSPEKTTVTVDPATGNVYTVNKSVLDGHAQTGARLPGFPVTTNLSGPCGVTTDAEGNVWVGDQAERQIREFNSLGESVRVIDTTFLEPGRPSQGMVCNVAMDKGTGDLYVTDSPNYGADKTVWKLTAASNYSTASEFVSVPPNTSGFRSFAIDSARHVVYLVRGNQISAYNTNGALLEQIESATGNYETIAVDESTGVLYTTDFTEPSRQIQVFVPRIVPDANTGEPSGDSQASGFVDPAGGGEVTECKFEWGPTAAYGEAPVACSPATPYAGTEPQTVTADLPGLEKEVTYHYRLVASNANGTNIGLDETITPHDVSFLRTTSATDVDRHCATLNGAFEGNGEDTHYNFEYGTTAAYGQTAVPSPGEDAGEVSGPQEDGITVCGLEAQTTYHFRFIGSNGIGSSVGRDRTFTTLPAVAGIATDPASSIGGVEATIDGHWTGDETPTSYHFEWGFTKRYGNSTPETDVAAGSGTQTGSATITGLFQSTVYHYRIVVTNTSGTTYGPDLTFKTLILATLAYQPPTHLTTSSAELHATVNPENAGPTTFHFDYGSDQSYGQSTPESSSVGSDDTAHPVAETIDGLSPGQTYHYRIVATSPAGVAVGEDRTVTAVPNLPTVVGQSAEDVTSDSARLSAEARPGFGPTVVLFEYGPVGTLTSHTRTTPPIGSDDSPHAASLPVANLLPGTTYTYRAVAINVAGSSVGPEQTFTTSNHPSVDAVTATPLSPSSAAISALVNPDRETTTYHVEFGPTEDYGSRTPESAPIGSDAVSHPISAVLGGLAPATTYHYRVVAANAVGIVEGPDRTFTTLDAPEPVVPQPPHCRRGRVLRHGKCVRKHRRHRHERRHRRHRRKHHHHMSGGRHDG